MKYNTKTAVHITDEFTRQNLIEFFESIKSDCNEVFWEIFQIDTDDIWFIDEYGTLTFYDETDDLSDYTIIEGIPQNWREEMAKPETDLQSRVNELEKCLKLTYQQLKMWNTDFPFNNEDVELKNTIEKLLNK